jgi:hypothetical protein
VVVYRLSTPVQPWKWNNSEQKREHTP